MNKSLLCTLILAVAGCGGERAEPGSRSARLSAVWNNIDCGYEDGRICRTTTPLADGLKEITWWDPCHGGSFTWKAHGSLETGIDRICVGGFAVAGPAGGCLGGEEITGSGYFAGKGDGLTTIGVATDASGSSFGVSELEAICDEPLFSAVFAPVPAADRQRLVVGLSWDDFVAEWKAASVGEERLTKIEVWYEPGGLPRFDGLFEPGTGGHGLNAGMTLDELRSTTAANAELGLVLSDLEAQQIGGGLVYVGVYVAGSRPQTIYEGFSADFWAFAAPYIADGYHPTIVESHYDAEKRQRYTVVLEKDGAPRGWLATAGVPYPDFAREWRENTDRGFFLRELETHVIAGVRHYDGFFAPRAAGAHDFAPGTRLQQLREKMRENAALGLGIVDFDRLKQARTGADAYLEERPVSNEYPAVAPEWIATVERYFEETYGKPAMGYTVALLQGSELLGATSAGWSDGPAEGAVRMTPDTHWDYLSVSKFVTGLAALKVAQDAGLDIATEYVFDHIQDRLDLTVVGERDDNDLWNITIWHALTHRSNLANGGCNTPPDHAEGLENRILPSMQGELGVYNYSGFNSCMLRLFVEEVSGKPFEQYVSQDLMRPIGVHNFDCQVDPEHEYARLYWSPDDFYADPDGNVYPWDLGTWGQCSAGGFKGTVFDILKLMAAIRNPGLFDVDSLGSLRVSEFTFYLEDFAGVDGFAMTGGLGGSKTHIAQFADPERAGPIRMRAPWTEGIDAVFFTNSGPKSSVRTLFEAFAADPTP